MLPQTPFGPDPFFAFVHAAQALEQAVLPHTPSGPNPFFALEHAMHEAPQALLQQTPSTQEPLTHSALAAQLCASGSLQAPAASHTSAPAHSASGSVLVAIAPHCPLVPPPRLAALHAWQPVAHALLQQTPSAQNPLAHSAPSVHAVPVEHLSQDAFPSQRYPPAH